MLESLARAVTEKAKASSHLSAAVEGQSRDGWLVIDLGDVVIHLFSPDQRAYYRLEQLWEKGKILLRMQ